MRRPFLRLPSPPGLPGQPRVEQMGKSWKTVWACRLLVVFLFSSPAGAVGQGSGSLSGEKASELRYDRLREQALEFERPWSMVKQIVRVVSPCVAHIEARKTQASASLGGSDRNRTVVVEEAGSGVIYQYGGRYFVITNFHVVENSAIEDIRIEAGGRIFHPTRLAHDPDTDLSVLFTDRNDLEACRPGDSREVEIGDFVVAVGSPFGLSHSVSYGIISAKGRRDLELGPQGVRYQDFFQTDAAINPGNSGGPLINLRGEVIGINTAIASNSGGNDGIGFSIPMAMVSRIVDDLIEFGEVERGFLGVSLDARYTPERGLALGLDLAYGTRVSGVTPESPAEKAGLQVGDILLTYGEIPIANDSHLVTEVSLSRRGDRVPLRIYRAGKFQELLVTIEDRDGFDPPLP